MQRSKNTLYFWLLAASAGGITWLMLNLTNGWLAQANGPTLCYFKTITGLSCPSCGTTRSAALFLHGQWEKAIMMNPLGFVALCLLVLVPLFIFFDVLTKKEYTLYMFQWLEIQCRRPIIYIPSLVLVLLNWIWNIYKNV